MNVQLVHPLTQPWGPLTPPALPNTSHTSPSLRYLHLTDHQHGP